MDGGEHGGVYYVAAVPTSSPPSVSQLLRTSVAETLLLAPSLESARATGTTKQAAAFAGNKLSPVHFTMSSARLPLLLLLLQLLSPPQGSAMQKCRAAAAFRPARGTSSPPTQGCLPARARGVGGGGEAWYYDRQSGVGCRSPDLLRPSAHPRPRFSFSHTVCYPSAPPSGSDQEPLRRAQAKQATCGERKGCPAHWHTSNPGERRKTWHFQPSGLRLLAVNKKGLWLGSK